MDLLPEEITLKIANYLDTVTLTSFMRTSKTNNRIGSEEFRIRRYLKKIDEIIYRLKDSGKPKWTRKFELQSVDKDRNFLVCYDNYGNFDLKEYLKAPPLFAIQRLNRCNPKQEVFLWSSVHKESDLRDLLLDLFRKGYLDTNCL